MAALAHFMAAHCPRCGSGQTRHSRRWKMRDLGALLLTLRPCRCRSCYSRFYLSWFSCFKPLGLPHAARTATPSPARR